MLEFTILTNDLVNRACLLAEHGLSIWIKTKGKQILFDTGQTSVFLQNALSMGIPVNNADAVVLSHGHYDHCGGVPSYPFNTSDTRIYVGQGAFQKKLSVKDGNARDIGIQWSPEFREEIKDRIVETDDCREIFSGIYILGAIEQTTDFETVSPCFFTEKNEIRTKDLMNDEQLLVVEENDKLAVFSGCSHKGIVNCVEYVKKRFPGKRIDTIVAGMHLRNAGEERLKATVDYLAGSGIEHIIPLHCTGIQEACELKRVLCGKCRLFAAGDSALFD